MEELIKELRRRAGIFTSLDNREDSDLADMGVDFAAGFVPGVGQALSARDFERARREGDVLGMGLSTLGMIPVAGGVPRTIMMAAKKGGKKGKKAVGTVFDNVTDYNEALRMALRGDHLKRTPEGKYVGAPADVDSPQKLARNRTNALRRVEQGAFNANWYDRARDAASEVSGGNDEMAASMFARGGAAYSPQATPEVEVGALLRQHNAKVLRGEDAVPRTGSQARNVGRAYSDRADGGYDIDPSVVRLGRKTGPYADAKDPTIPTESLYKTANDIWHGRVMGYGEDFDRGFTPQEHGFLTGENLVLANSAQQRSFGEGVLPEGYEWTPRSAQAATWGSARLDTYRGEYEKKLAKYDKDYKAKLAKALRAGKKEPAYRPPAPPAEKDLMARASYGIDSALPRYTANDTFEFVTGENTGHLAGLNRADEATRSSYTDAMGEAYLRPPAGSMRDPIYDSFQMYQREALPTQGTYMNSAGELERNPGFTTRPLVSLQSSDLGKTASGKPRRGGPEMVPEDTRAMRYAGALRGLVTGQEATGFNKFTPANSSMKATEKTGARYTANTPEELEAARKAFEAQGLDVVQVGDALHIGKFPDDAGNVIDPKELQKRVKAAQQGLSGDTVAGRWETGLEVIPWTQQQGTGQTTRAILDRLVDNPDYAVKDAAKRIDAGRLRSAMKPMNEIDRALAAEKNLPIREDLMKLREMLADVGLEGVIEYVKKTGGVALPAIAAVPTLSSLLSQPDDREQL
jgi:hypothetical protein